MQNKLTIQERKKEKKIRLNGYQVELQHFWDIIKRKINGLFTQESKDKQKESITERKTKI